MSITKLFMVDIECFCRLTWSPPTICRYLRWSRVLSMSPDRVTFFAVDMPGDQYQLISMHDLLASPREDSVQGHDASRVAMPQSGEQEQRRAN
jgi:hypothetical protein